ncbi:MAG: NUDIX hydrolase [Pseudomonadota bacterium]
MALQKVKQLPLSVDISDKRDVRTQFGALCYRVRDKKTEVLMISSRRTGRWVIPKGWPMDGKAPAECALTEAWEEAGAIGKVAGECLGLFSYNKGISENDRLPCAVMVYPIKVKKLADTFPESEERNRKWMSPKKAAKKVDEPELAHLLSQFDPKILAT